MRYGLMAWLLLAQGACRPPGDGPGLGDGGAPPAQLGVRFAVTDARITWISGAATGRDTAATLQGSERLRTRNDRFIVEGGIAK